MNCSLPRRDWRAALLALAVLAGCSSTGAPGGSAATAPATTPTSATATAPTPPAPNAAGVAPKAAASPTPSRVVEAPRAMPAPLPPNTFVAPAPIRFEDAVARAGQELFAQARAQLGEEARGLVVDPLIDANTGGQTIGTARMGSQLESIVRSRYAVWSVKPLTRQSLATQPLLHDTKIAHRLAVWHKSNLRIAP